MDRPRIRVIPEAFGSGTLPRKELKDAARLGGTVLRRSVDEVETEIAAAEKAQRPDSRTS
jgi:hypothetical protein